ncbi:hypothetical protein [Halalkalibacterium ligniniphilum]|uniref:hypothetical protein n=1 Tax=Halalkalibacterium ligniniphilum TaxID=1134413 RepID=UPI000348D6AF|nr:hypothetical protein [Halalkalibacterium ligniniphilum]
MGTPMLPEANELAKVLYHVRKTNKATQADFQHMYALYQILRKEYDIDPNFQGTLDELQLFFKEGQQEEQHEDFIPYYDLNIKRWIEELTLLGNGSKAVTIDYQQRKGREI